MKIGMCFETIAENKWLTVFFCCFDRDSAQLLCFTRVILRKVGQYGTESRFATDLMPARRQGRGTFWQPGKTTIWLQKYGFP